MDAFKDDENFTELLFDTCFDDCCFYLIEGETVVSMLFAFDVFLNGVMGKYIYGVVTNEEFRGKGYMRKLFKMAEEKLRGEYKFLCLRPMNEPLFEFYDKLGFTKKFYKSKIDENAKNLALNSIKLNSANEFMFVRKSLLKQNSVEFGDKLSYLLMSYCDAYTDSVKNPRFLSVRERESGKVKEILGEPPKMSKEFSRLNSYTDGNDYCYAVYKSLGYDFNGKGYLGLAMD